MDWLLIGLSILVNIVSIVMLLQCKKLNNFDETFVEQSIEEFVSRIEKENDVLYQKFVDYIKVKECAVEEKLRKLEERLETESTSTSIFEQPSENQNDVNQSNFNEESSADQEKEKISQLYKQGFSSKQIAKVLQMDFGKVELIINMFKKRQSF